MYIIILNEIFISNFFYDAVILILSVQKYLIICSGKNESAAV